MVPEDAGFGKFRGKTKVPSHSLPGSGFRYVRLSDIPEAVRVAFEKYLAGSTVPYVEAELDPRGCAYEHDWHAFEATQK